MDEASLWLVEHTAYPPHRIQHIYIERLELVPVRINYRRIRMGPNRRSEVPIMLLRLEVRSQVRVLKAFGEHSDDMR